MDKCVRGVLCLIIVMLVSIAMVSLAHAQPAQIGYVDMKRVLDNAPQVVAGRSLLDQEFRSRNDAIELDESRLTLMESQLAQADMTSDEYRRLERDALELRRNVERRKEDLRDELSFRRTEEVQRLEVRSDRQEHGPPERRRVAGCGPRARPVHLRHPGDQPG